MQGSGFVNHYQLVVILSYFEIDRLDWETIAEMKIYFPLLGLSYRDPIFKVIIIPTLPLKNLPVAYILYFV
jgi:hypothetical protein